ALNNGVCASVMPSCDCNVRMRWSTAAWVAAEGAGALDDDWAAAGAALGGVGAAVCAKPTEGTSKAATETLRKKFAVNIIALLRSAQRLWPWPPPKPPPPIRASCQPPPCQPPPCQPPKPRPCHPPCQPPPQPQPRGPGGRPSK